MYQVISRCYPAPSARGGKYRRPVRIMVVRQFKPAYRFHGDPDVVEQWSNVDSRYDGPRSAHGQALAAARELCERLNASMPTGPVVFDNEGGFRVEGGAA